MGITRQARGSGKEFPIGKGRVDFRTLISKLASLGFSGSLTIERRSQGLNSVEIS